MMTKEQILNLCESVPLMVSTIFIFFYKKYTRGMSRFCMLFYKFKILFLLKNLTVLYVVLHLYLLNYLDSSHQFYTV
jgi:hypothetical protein